MFDRSLISGLLLPYPLIAQDLPVAPSSTEYVEQMSVPDTPVPQDRLKKVQGVLILGPGNEVLFSKNQEEAFPIASITKLMTALVFLEHDPGFSKKIIIKKKDDAEPVKIPLKPGDRVRVKDLFASTLVGSRNNAARALAHATGISEPDFIALMNAKARQLGMGHTTFVDTTGLDPKNESTPRDIAVLGQVAFANQKISKALLTDRYSFEAFNTKTGKRHRFTIRNTNPFLKEAGAIKEGKTGYIDESGYNFVARGSVNGKELIAVVFGAKTSKSRFNLTRDLVNAALSTVHKTASR